MVKTRLPVVLVMQRPVTPREHSHYPDTKDRTADQRLSDRFNMVKARLPDVMQRPATPRDPETS